VRAREGPPGPGEVTAADLAARVRRAGRDVCAGHETSEIVEHLQRDLRPGDVLVTMGAGNIGKICHELLERFRVDRAAG
jgi:UDP-N-acetylmuramate-alanine ligase